MHDAVVVQVCHSGKNGTNKIRSVGFVVTALSANAIEKLATKRKIGNQIHCKLRG